MSSVCIPSFLRTCRVIVNDEYYRVRPEPSENSYNLMEPEGEVKEDDSAVKKSDQ